MNKLIAGLGLAAALTVSGCQTISTKDLPTVNTPFPDAPPALVVVRDFETLTVTLKKDARDGNFAERIVQTVSMDLMQGFKAANHETQRLFSGQEASSYGWVVTGRLRLVQWSNDEADAKGDRIECTAYVYDVSKTRTQPFLTFEVSAPRLAGDPADSDSGPATDSDSSLKATCEALSQIIVQRVQDYIGKNF